MSDMIERVARAICKADGLASCAMDDERAEVDTCTAANCSRFLQARAAIEAMRTPTEAMVRATDSYDRYRAAIEDEWRLMIDRALKEMP